MSNTKPHLSNNSGVRAHSSDRYFRLFGVTKFCYIRGGKIIRMDRWPNGGEVLRGHPPKLS